MAALIWVDVGETYQDSAKLHNDQHSFAIDPSDPSEFYVGNDGGIFKMAYDAANRTGTFQSLNANLQITQFYHLALHPTDPTRLMGGCQDNAGPASLGNLAAWANPGAGDGAFVLYDPLNPEIAYSGTQNLGVNRTTNGWTGNSDITGSEKFDNQPTNFEPPLAMAAGVPFEDYSYLLAGTDTLWVWDPTDGWAPYWGSANKPLTKQTLRVIAYSANAGVYTGGNDGELYLVAGENGSATYRVDNNAFGGSPISDISPSPSNPYEVLVAVTQTGKGGNLFRCQDVDAYDQQVWSTAVCGSGTTALPEVPINAICRDPYTPETTWYVATDVGVFMTINAGGNWYNMTQPLGLPNVQVNSLQANGTTGYLYAGTFGRGIWKIALLNTAGLYYSGWPKFHSNVANGGDGLGAGATSKQTWSFTAGNWIQSGIAIGPSGTIYAGAEDNKLYAINPTTGKQVWTFTTGGPIYSTPAVGADGTVYVGSNDNKVYAINGVTGAKKWSYTTGDEVLSSPTIGGNGTLYVTSEDGLLYALNTTTGKLIWSFTTDYGIESSPAIGSDGTVYFGADDLHFYAVNGTTGKMKWSYDLGDYADSSPAIAANGLVYFGCEDNNLYALDSTTGAFKWKFATGSTIYSSPAVSGSGNVYVGSEDYYVYAVNGTTGKKIWSFKTGGEVNSSPAIGADGTVYVGSDQPYTFYALNGATGKVAWSLQGSGYATCSPAISPNGTVYSAIGAVLYAFH